MNRATTAGEDFLTRRDWLKTMALASAAAACPLTGRAAPSAADQPTGLTAAQRQALRAVIDEAISRKSIPGAALVVLSRGGVVFREAFGRLEFEAERPFTTEAPCFIASLTKPITATFFVSLDERRAISLDDPVEKYLPEFKGVEVQGKGPATTTLQVWHLLSHRSGLPGNADLGDARRGRSPLIRIHPTAGQARNRRDDSGYGRVFENVARYHRSPPDEGGDEKHADG